MTHKQHKAFREDVSSAIRSEAEVKHQLGLTARSNSETCFKVYSNGTFEFNQECTATTDTQEFVDCDSAHDACYINHGLADEVHLVPHVLRIYALGRCFNTLEQIQAHDDSAFRDEYKDIEVLGESDTAQSYGDLAWQKHIMSQIETSLPDVVVLDPDFESNHNMWTAAQADFVAEVF